MSTPCAQKLASLVLERHYGTAFKGQKFSSAFANRIDNLRQLEVQFRKPAGIMCAEGNVDPVVDIEPFRVVIHLLRDQGHSGHKAKSSRKISELE